MSYLARTLAIVILTLCGLCRIAMAQCASGYYPCGSDYCTPNGNVCCASVGYPQGNCPAGDTCNSDGTCSALGTTWPGAEYAQYADARVNPPLFFRHGLKILHGQTITLGTCNTVLCGLSIAAENPAYLQGDFNSPTNGAYVASTLSPGTSVAADAVTLLSDGWNDVNSFWYPYNPGNRPGAGGTTYRVAIIAGKGVQFPQIGATQDYGTDGGVHNFLRYLEGWGGTLYYEGSLVSFYYNQQAVGLYKCCTIVYGPPTRDYTFDTNFQTPALLPPSTPMLRDVNNIGFSEVVSPSQ